MEQAARGFGAFCEAIVFWIISKICQIADSAARWCIRLRKFCCCACLRYSPERTVVIDIARFGEKKLDLLRRFRPFRGGTPSHDHLGDIFGTLDAGAFRRCFVAWVAAPTKTPSEVIAIDGKTLRRSYQKKDSKAPIHMVSAFAARQRLVLGQVKVNEKSNEIVAISALLEMMAIEGAVITLDAMGCQRGIAKKIMDRKADYIIALKGNQGTLLEDVQVFAIEQKTRGFKDTKVSLHETSDGDYGRIERLWCTDIGVAAFYTSSH